MSKRNQFNIGETQRTSIKVHHNPVRQSNWSFGWQNQQPNKSHQPKIGVNYKNHSNIIFQDNSKHQEEEIKKKQEKQKKQDEFNNKVPYFDPKKGGLSSFSFGTEPTNYRKKDQVFTSVKVTNPPGGKSSIQFG